MRENHTKANSILSLLKEIHETYDMVRLFYRSK